MVPSTLRAGGRGNSKYKGLKLVMSWCVCGTKEQDGWGLVSRREWWEMNLKR